MKRENIYIGMHVLYVPDHAKDDLKHKDVEPGVVTAVHSTVIFVLFGGDVHSKACRAEQLR